LGAEPKQACNIITNQFAELLKESGDTPTTSNVTPAHIVDLLKLVSTEAISSKMGKDVFAESFHSGKLPAQIVQEKGLVQISDTSAIESVVQQVLQTHSDVVAKYKSGQANVKGFLVGQVIRGMGGKANPAMVQDLVQSALERE
jgi:aspartyl-tRNA(Asn)/glutamyl-tRNA(Gln) amidotransferase subunit B